MAGIYTLLLNQPVGTNEPESYVQWNDSANAYATSAALAAFVNAQTGFVAVPQPTTSEGVTESAASLDFMNIRASFIIGVVGAT